VPTGPRAAPARMPISATGRAVPAPRPNGFGTLRRYAESGFTLLELMVVIVIIGLASAAVVLALPDGGGRLDDEAARLAARALAVRDDAILQGRSTRLVVDPGGYAAERRAFGKWQGYGGKAFEPVALPQGIVAATGDTGRIVVTFDATGATEPATIDLVRDGRSVRVDIPASGAAHVR
jgi:general secretion pathway protein H